MISLSDHDALTARDFAHKMPQATASGPPSAGGGEFPLLSLDDYTRRFIEVWQDRFTDTELAKRLGVSRKTLWEKRKKYGLPRKG